MVHFVVLTYNHENYILENLESIKYQILKYNITNAIITIIDDFSKDNTVKLINYWLRRNPVFFEVILLFNTENKGTVHNFITALTSIKYKRYKIIAGDDLFNFYSILEIPIDYDLVISPVQLLSGSELTFSRKYYYKRATNINYLKRKLKEGNLFSAPGVFLGNILTNDISYFEFIQKYKYIEDYPSWIYLFLLKDELSYKIINKEYVIYRTNTGIYGNNSTNSIKNSLLQRDIDLLNEELIGFRLNKYLDFRNYLDYFVSKVYDITLKILKNKEINKVREYYKYISVKSKGIKEEFDEFN